MSNTESIKSFVKGPLGCECPDDLFNSVQVQENVKLNVDLKLKSKITVGNRLLIYMINADDVKFVQDHLSAIIFIGKDEKDLKNFNKLRIVLLTEKLDVVKKSAEGIYGDLKDILGIGDTIHLHVLKKSDVLI